MIFRLSLILVFCAAAICGNAQQRRHVLRVADYSALYVKGPCMVELRNRPDSAGMLVVTATDEAFAGLSKAHDNGTLYLSVDHADNSLKPIVAYLPSGMEDFNLITGNGASVNSDGFKCGMLYVSVTGRGNVTLAKKVEASNVNCSLTGNARLTLGAITAKSLSATLKGSGMMMLGGKISGQSAFVVKGSGDIDIRNLQSVAIRENLSGDGKIIK